MGALCPTCRGAGVTSLAGVSAYCPTCHGAGQATWLGESWWAWVHPVSLASITQRRFEQVVKLMVSGLMIAFTVIGIGIGGPMLFEAAVNGNLLETLLTRDVRMAAWWFGIMTGVYLTYRLERDATMALKIPTGGHDQPFGAPWTGAGQIHDLAEVFSEPGLKVVDQAWQLAAARRQPNVTPAHVIEILSSLPAIASMLIRMGLVPTQFRERLAGLDQPATTNPTTPQFTSATRELVLRAFHLAAKQRQDRVTPPFIMAAITQIDDPARELLYDLGVDESKLDHVMAWLLIQEDLRTKLRRYRQRAALKPKGVIDRGYTAMATPILDRFSQDLTWRAKQGLLPYVIGRDEELTKLWRVLGSTGHSVMIIGDVGVGKSNLLAAVAERMVTEDVPEPLQDKRLVSLSAGALVAGAGGMGELEERVTGIVHELIRAGNIVLAIEDFDQLVGVSSSGSGLDAAHILAQELQRGTFLAIATAQTGAYRRVIEPAGLGNAFQTVEISEMTPEQAIVAIESRVGGLEAKHRAFFTYDAIDHAVRLSQRYLHERTLPGKALEVLEEAAALAVRARGKNGLVLKDDVDTVITEQAKVNVQAVTQDEQTKLLNLESEIHRRVIGQDEAVKAVSNALRRARAEIRDTNRPIASFLFLGPTGVGKTELAKTVAAVYFGDEHAMVRLDMSEYQEIQSISRMLGSAGGGTGQLTEAVRTKPFSLVLLDELEKAHPDVLNLFLQVMDDGRLTDASGRTIDFTNTIIIATSNAGTQHVQNRLREGARIETIQLELMNQVLQQYFRPEFLNRFDAVVIFKPLSPIQVVKIVGLMMEQVAAQLKTKGISFQATPEAVAEMAQQGFDPTFGARPLRRLVQERVDDALAKHLLQGKLGRRDKAILEVGGVIRVEKANKV